MGRRAALLLCVCTLGCDEGGDGGGAFESSTTPSTKKGGFSADLAKEGSGSGTVATNDKGSDAKPADPKPAEGSDSAKPAGGSGDTKPADTKPADTKPADTKPADTKPADTKPTDTKPADTKPADTKPADTKPADTKPADTKPAVKGPPPIDTDKPRVYVKPPADIAGIKLSLLPNWDRDYGEAGTISLVVKVPGTDKTQVFAFRYGFEDPKAPSDREAYKKWLADSGVLKAPADKPLIDRQRGSTWYLEGVDGSGSPIFRNVVVFGGKKLICGGSLYRDAVHNALGDIRDKTVLQAKEICGDLGL
jgi:hypothetical protein